MHAGKILAVILALSLLLPAPRAYAVRADTDMQLLAFIEALCYVNEISPKLVYAVIEMESSWQANAVNPAGNCLGLMQISRIHKARLRDTLGIEDLFDPYQNVMAGITMLADYVHRYGDYDMALMCYNCGEAGARERFAQGICSTGYSRWIVRRMEEMEGSS